MMYDIYRHATTDNDKRNKAATSGRFGRKRRDWRLSICIITTDGIDPPMMDHRDRHERHSSRACEHARPPP